MAGNGALSAAVKAKKDEFYTQLTDIEKEMRYYRKHFKDKIVLCNCDDPFESNFFKYFVLNFNRLGLKKLIATCYFSSPIIGQQLQYHFNQDGQMPFCSVTIQAMTIKPNVHTKLSSHLSMIQQAMAV